MGQTPGAYVVVVVVLEAQPGSLQLFSFLQQLSLAAGSKVVRLGSPEQRPLIMDRLVMTFPAQAGVVAAWAMGIVQQGSAVAVAASHIFVSKLYIGVDPEQGLVVTVAPLAFF